MKHKGFTLIELIVVVGLITILLILVLSSFSRNRMKTRDNVRVADINTIRIALEQYRATCGVFPATLELTADNGRTGTCGSTLGDFIPEIPTAPTRDENSLLISGTVPAGSVFNGYFYAGLSTTLNGPCYEYHLGSELEFATNNNEDDSRSLDEDHDFEDGAGTYDSKCASSVADFGTSIPTTDDDNGLYDFRSTNNQ